MQFVVATFLHDQAPVQKDDAVGPHPMRHHHHRPRDRDTPALTT
ncbi:hypothetical protein ACIBKY_32740 [Nonomuraea sp. NPDC050394]